MILTQTQLDFWKENGYLVIKDYFTEAGKKELVEWVGDMETRPETPGKWMKYFEQSGNNERLLCRIENFLDYEATLNALATGPLLTTWLGQLMAEPAVLFKEKINFKLPGANGFEPHPR